jgi:aminoglycoside phosphotransferase family enzyme
VGGDSVPTLAFLDFSDPAERLADCLREVQLNRRLAPDVDLGIAPILSAGNATSKVCVGPVAETPTGDDLAVEHCVVMRRLEEGRDLRSLLEQGRIQAAQLDRVAERLARFHADHSLGQPAPHTRQEWLDRSTAPARANLEALASVSPDLAAPDVVEEARRLAGAFAESRREDFEARRRNGRVVDGHGDLHAEHVWFEHDDSEPLMIDCLEFRDDFRRIDVASDAAFLAMDLAYRGRGDLGARFLRRYARSSGDYQLFRVVDYFLS